MTNSRAAQFDKMCCSCGPRDATLIGTATAPSQAQPSTISKNSIRFEQMTATRSPGSMPAERKVPAQRTAASYVSA